MALIELAESVLPPSVMKTMTESLAKNFEVKIGNIQNEAYVVTLNIGQSNQLIDVKFDTLSKTNWLFDQSCKLSHRDLCSDYEMYNPDKSTSKNVPDPNAIQTINFA